MFRKFQTDSLGAVKMQIFTRRAWRRAEAHHQVVRDFFLINLAPPLGFHDYSPGNNLILADQARQGWDPSRFQLWREQTPVVLVGDDVFPVAFSFIFWATTVGAVVSSAWCRPRLQFSPAFVANSALVILDDYFDGERGLHLVGSPEFPMCAGVARRKPFPDSDLAADAAVLVAVTAMLYLALSPERRSCPCRREEVEQEMWFGLLPSSALCIRLDAGIGTILIPGIPYFFGEKLLRHFSGSLFLARTPKIRSVAPIPIRRPAAKPLSIAK